MTSTPPTGQPAPPVAAIPEAAIEDAAYLLCLLTLDNRRLDAEEINPDAHDWAAARNRYRYMVERILAVGLPHLLTAPTPGPVLVVTEAMIRAGVTAWREVHAVTNDTHLSLHYALDAAFAAAPSPPAAPGLDDDPFGYRPIPGQPSPRIDRAFSCCGSNDPDCPGDHPECHPDGVIAAPELDAFASRMDIEVAISRLDSAMDELWGIIDPDYVATEADDFSLPEMSFLATTALAEVVAQLRASRAERTNE